MPVKLKVNCPNRYHDTHRHTKFLFGYQERAGKAPRVFFFHCGDQNCRVWTKVMFNEKGGFIVEILPKSYPLNLIKVPFSVRVKDDSR